MSVACEQLVPLSWVTTHTITSVRQDVKRLGVVGGRYCRPVARTPRSAPRAHLDDPDADFAHGTIGGSGPDADAARAVQQLAARISAAAAEHGSVRSVAADAGLDFSAVYAAVRGDAWLDTRTLALLERVLGPLWPGPAD